MTERLVQVLSTRSVPEAEIARTRLEDEQIPVMVNGADGPYRLGPVYLFVPAAFEVQARLVLASVAPVHAEVDEGDGPQDVGREDRG
jgi:hypothetical protein